MDRLTRPVQAMIEAAWPGRKILMETVHGRTSSVSFIRAGGDPYRSDARATVVSEPVEVVQAGYFLPGKRGGAVSGGDRASVAPTISEQGIPGLTTGDGVFAFAAWNSETERFVASVDKLGMRPLFWCDVPGGGVAVASEIKSLIPLLGDLRVNWPAWEDQLRLGYPLGDHTVVQGIHRFRRAGCLTWDGERTSHTVVERFLESAVEEPFRPDEFVERNHAAFMDGMQDLVQLADHDPLLLTLSAGLDSRRILAGIRELGRDVELLTAAVPRSSGVAEEMAIVQLLATQVGTTITEYRSASPNLLARAAHARDAYADFETDEHATYALFAGAGQRRGINFDGMAGDTLLNPGLFLRPEYLTEGGEARFLNSLSSSGGGRWALLPAGGEPFEERLHATWQSVRDSVSPITLMALDTRARRVLALGPITVQGRAFESVFPFLNRSFVSSGLSLPPAERLRGLLQRQLTRRIDASLADLPSSRDPGFYRPNGMRPVDPLWLLLRPRQTIARALWRGRSRARAPLPQLGKFLGAAVMGARIGEDRYDWQWGKAERFRRMREHEDLMSAGWQSYTAFVAAAVQPQTGAVATRSMDP